MCNLAHRLFRLQLVILRLQRQINLVCLIHRLMDGWMDGCTVLLHCIIWDPLIYIHLSIHPSIHPPRRTLDVCYYLFVSSPYLFLIPDFPAGNIPMCNVPWGTYTKVLKYTPWRRRAPKARSVQDRRKERIPSRCQTYLRFLSLLYYPKELLTPAR